MLNKIKHTSPVVGNFTDGDNALATVKDVNRVISHVNKVVFYRPYDMVLTQSGTAAPSMAIMMAGECNSNCTGQADECGCPDRLNEKNGLVASVSRTGVGVYRVTFNTTNTTWSGKRGYGVYVEPLRNVAHALILDKKSVANALVIKTYSGGVAADDILDAIHFSLRIY